MEAFYFCKGFSFIIILAKISSYCQFPLVFNFFLILIFHNFKLISNNIKGLQSTKEQVKIMVFTFHYFRVISNNIKSLQSTKVQLKIMEYFKS